MHFLYILFPLGYRINTVISRMDKMLHNQEKKPLKTLMSKGLFFSGTPETPYVNQFCISYTAEKQKKQLGPFSCFFCYIYLIKGWKLYSFLSSLLIIFGIIRNSQVKYNLNIRKYKKM